MLDSVMMSSDNGHSARRRIIPCSLHLVFMSRVHPFRHIAGVRRSKLGTILRGNSQVLCVDPDTLRARISWMESPDIGFRDVGAVIESWPRILGMRQETVETRIKAIKDALGEERAVEFFNRFPRCLVRSWELQSSRLQDLDLLCPAGTF